MSAINSIETLRKALPELDSSDLFADCGYTLNIRQVEDLILNKTKGQAVSPLVLRMALVFASEMTYTRFCFPDGKIKPGHVVCRLGHTVTPSEPKALEALAGYFSPVSEFRCGRPGEDSGFTVELSQDDANIINACDTWTLYPKSYSAFPRKGRGLNINGLWHLPRPLPGNLKTVRARAGEEHLVISRKCETLYNFTPRSSLTMKGAVSNYLKTLSDNRFFRRPKSLNKADRVSIDAYDIFDSTYQMSRLAQIAYSNFTQSELTLEAEQPSIQPEQPRTAQPSFSGFDYFGTLKEIRARMSLMITGIDRLGDDDASIHGHALLKRLKELAND